MALQTSSPLEKVTEIAGRVAASLGLEVVEVELLGSGKHRTLRLFIDKLNPVNLFDGVTHEDCSNVSRDVSVILDVEDTVPGGNYTLEVSSPGLDRKLFREKDFARFQGSLVKLSTYQPVNGNRHFEGRLVRFAEGRLTLELATKKRKKKDAAKIEKREKIEKSEKTDKAELEDGTLEVAFADVEKANLVPEI